MVYLILKVERMKDMNYDSFNTVNSHAIGIYDSWEIVNDITAIKYCDKSFFEYNSSGIPKEIDWFFDAEKLGFGDEKKIVLFFEGDEYNCRVYKEPADRRRVKISWPERLGSKFKSLRDEGKRQRLHFHKEKERYTIVFETGEEKEDLTRANLSEAIGEAVACYKRDITNFWKEEKYKWIAVKHFQSKWDIEAESFAEMLEESFASASNLLSGGNYYPYKMICSFARFNPEKVRELFRLLYDRTIPFSRRIRTFREECATMLEQLRERIPGYEKAMNYYQDLRAICVYLSFEYPDEYFLYKYQMYYDFKKAIGYQELSKEEDYYVRQYENFERLCQLVISEAKRDEELMRMQRELVVSEPRAYADPEYHLMAQTIIYVYKRAVAKDEKDAKEKVVYWPTEDEYAVDISKEEWKKYIEDVEWPNYPSSMAMLKALLELGGEASCKKLAEIYGGHPSRYISIAANIGKRAKKYFGLSACMDGEVERFFPIPFWGREVTVEGTKYYSYKLREALQQALEELDLTDVNPYFDEDIDEEPDTKAYEEYTKANFLNEVFMKEKDYDTLVSLLVNKKNIILQGAPGVGKTFAAKRLAYSMMGEKNENRIQFVQFHQNYSYEDFVMGYRPNESGFELKYGIFYQFCKTAEKHPEDKYFFIIDEINRGNLSKIFGELLMLIEKDYRGDETTLAYDGATFSVPKNLFIIGMMNTADRSLAMIDYALRRRFSFYTMNPGFESEGFVEYQKGFANPKLDRLVQEVIDLNKAIMDDKSLGAGFCIGHSYFCGHTADEDDSWIGEIVDFDIIPTLMEYWFDDADKVQKWTDNLKGAINGQ